MAGVVLGDIDFYSGVAGVALMALHGLALVARLVLGVAPGTPRLLAWQAWHFVTSTFTLRGRRGTYGTGLALVARLVPGVAPGTPRLLAWQAWHFVTSTFTLCGRRGTS